MAKSSKVVAAQREVFLAALERCGNVVDSCATAKLIPRTAYNWRKADPEFAKQWEEALERGADALEAEAVRRAHDGVEKPVYQGGKLVGQVREYSDQLLMFLLKGVKPDKYKDRTALDLNVVTNLAGRLEAAQKRIEDKS